MSERDTRYDINNKRLWQDTVKEGDRGERLVKRLLDLGIETIEVKNDQKSISTGNIFIETECYNEKNQEWYPSGINATQAKVWFYILNDTPFLALVGQPETIREAIKGMQARQANNTKPLAKGVLVSICELITRLRDVIKVNRSM
jgi:hypothetical protein